MEILALLPLLALTVILSTFVIWPTILYWVDNKNLRRFPNLHPLSGISNIPFTIESIRGFRSRRLAELHHKRGLPVIRIGPNALSYGVVDAIQPIYGHNTPTSKDKQYLNAAGTHFHLADVVDKKEHARKRRVLSSAFAAKNLEDWEYKVGDKVNKLIAQFDSHLRDKPTTPLDYRSWTNLYTIDSLCDICLSEQVRCIERGTDIVTAEDLAGNQTMVSFRDCLYAAFLYIGDLVWTYEWFPTVVKILGVTSPYYSRLFKLSQDWSDLVHHFTKTRWERYVRSEKIHDIFSALMDDNSGNAHNLEWGEVVAEMSLAISGSSSTSNSIASTMLLLIENPHALKKLQEEIDTAVDVDEVVVSYEVAKHLPYLSAVVDESLRLYPPISHGLPRETPQEGMQILEKWIAGNTTVSVPAYVAHRDPKVFPRPDVFQPERWFGEQGKQLQAHFIAFSTGARGCIGRPISYMLAKILLSSLVHRYDFSKFDPEWKASRRETMNLILGPVPVQICQRNLEFGIEALTD